MSGIPSGNNLRSRLSGMLVKNIRILRWGMLGSARGYSTSLSLIVASLEESVLTC